MARLTALSLIVLACACAADAQARTGAEAYGDWRSDAPGVTRKITVADLPPPLATRPSAQPSSLAPRPAGAALRALPGFSVQPFAKLQGPRMIRVAPNGDIFVAETDAGQVSVLRAADGADKPALNQVFVSGLDRPFGVAFYPPGPDPKWVYVASPNTWCAIPTPTATSPPAGRPRPWSPSWPRTPAATSPATWPSRRTASGSTSRSARAQHRRHHAQEDGRDQGLGRRPRPGRGLGQGEGRADVLVCDPDGRNQRVYATGIRNCVGLAIHPGPGVWCATNERDMLGDDLPPDYVTRVRGAASTAGPGTISATTRTRG